MKNGFDFYGFFIRTTCLVVAAGFFLDSNFIQFKLSWSKTESQNWDVKKNFGKKESTPRERENVAENNWNRLLFCPFFALMFSFHVFFLPSPHRIKEKNIFKWSGSPIDRAVFSQKCWSKSWRIYYASFWFSTSASTFRWLARINPKEPPTKIPQVNYFSSWKISANGILSRCSWHSRLMHTVEKIHTDADYQ